MNRPVFLFRLPRRVCAVLGFLLAFALTCRAGEAVEGRWEGSIKIPDQELQIIVDLARNKAGGWSGSIIMPGLDVKGAELTDISVNGSEVTFAIKSALGAARGGLVKFKGRAQGTSLTGDFTQGGNTAPFAMEKTGAPQVELPPQSTAIAEEFEGEWKGDYEMLGYPRHVTIKLFRHGGGPATAEFVIVGKANNQLPVDLVTQENDLITVQSHGTGIRFEGRLKKETGEIRGKVILGAIEAPLVLRHSK
jgi:hypothetical protein